MPASTTCDTQRLPEEFRNSDALLCWTYVQKGADPKPSKVPISPHTKRAAKVNDSDTWGTLDQCQRAMASRDDLGLAIALTGDLVLVDLDDCISEDGEIDELAEWVIEELDSYTEVSPSGRGVKCWVRATVPAGMRHEMPGQSFREIGIYRIREDGGGGRYCCLTGQRWGARQTVEQRTDELLAVMDRFGFTPRAAGAAPVVGAQPPRDGGFAAEDKPTTSHVRIAKYLEKIPPAISGQKGHSAALWAARVLVNGFALSEDDAFDCFSRHYNHRCDPPWSDREIWHKIKEAATKPSTLPASWLTRHPAAYIEPDKQWKKPKAFDLYWADDFEIEGLPPVIARFVDAVSETVQVDKSMVLSMALTCIGVCIKGRYDVRFGSTKEPVALWTAIVATKSERKSSAINWAAAPIRKWQEVQKERLQVEVDIYKSRQKRWESELHKIENRLGYDQDDTEIRDHHARKPQPINVPRVALGDVTAEALMMIACEQNGTASIISDEPAILMNAMGKYSSDGNDAFDTFLQMYSGQAITRHRVGTGESLAARGCLSILVGLQPYVLEKMGSRPETFERGFSDRFLWCVPRARRGVRAYRTPEVPPSVYADWSQLLRALLDRFDFKGDPVTIQLTPEADDMHEAFYDECNQMILHGVMKDLVGWSERISAIAARIAAIIAVAKCAHIVAQTLGDPPELVVQAGDMRIGCDIARSFIPHSVVAHEVMQSMRERAAETILRTAAKMMRDEPELVAVDRYHLAHGCVKRKGVATQNDFNAGVSRLEQLGWCECLTVPTAGRYKMMIRFHPLVVDKF